MAEKGQKRKADEKEHVSSTGEIYALVHHTCSKKHAEVAADRAENTVADTGILLYTSQYNMASSIGRICQPLKPFR